MLETVPINVIAINCTNGSAILLDGTAASLPSQAISGPVRHLLSHSLSAGTQRAYAADLAHFRTSGRDIPCPPQSIAEYLADLAETHAVATIQRRVAAIAKAHRASGFDDPCRSEIIRATMRGIRRTKGMAQSAAQALQRDDLFAVLERMGDRPIDVRDKALLLTGFTASRHAVPRFITGSKIPYRGRNMSLTVRRTDAERMAIMYRNGFIVDLPHWAGDDADHLVASELKLWLKQRARREVQEIATDYGKRFGLVPRSIRTTDLAHGWGSCGPEGNVLINWHLIFAPRKVLEYVVVHELAHLKHRSHGAEFWAYLTALMPGCENSRSWLDRHQSALSASFLA